MLNKWVSLESLSWTNQHSCPVQRKGSILQKSGGDDFLTFLEDRHHRQLGRNWCFVSSFKARMYPCYPIISFFCMWTLWLSVFFLMRFSHDRNCVQYRCTYNVIVVLNAVCALFFLEANFGKTWVLWRAKNKHLDEPSFDKGISTIIEGWTHWFQATAIRDPKVLIRFAYGIE